MRGIAVTVVAVLVAVGLFLGPPGRQAHGACVTSTYITNSPSPIRTAYDVYGFIGPSPFGTGVASVTVTNTNLDANQPIFIVVRDASGLVTSQPNVVVPAGATQTVSIAGAGRMRIHVDSGSPSDPNPIVFLMELEQGFLC